MISCLPWILLIYLLCMNMWAFAAFGWDKRKARKEQWRTPEKKLMILAALGGSIGALLGMRIFHHKTKKIRFSVGIPVIFVLQIAAMSGVIYLLLK